MSAAKSPEYIEFLQSEDCIRFTDELPTVDTPQSEAVISVGEFVADLDASIELIETALAARN